MNLIGTLQRVINPAAKIRNAVGRVETLVGIHLPGVVGIGRNLPSTDVDGLQPRLHLLHRLVAGHGAQSIDVFLAVQKFPQALGTEARKRSASSGPALADSSRSKRSSSSSNNRVMSSGVCFTA